MPILQLMREAERLMPDFVSKPCLLQAVAVRAVEAWVSGSHCLSGHVQGLEALKNLDHENILVWAAASGKQAWRTALLSRPQGSFLQASQVSQWLCQLLFKLLYVFM